MLTVKEFRSRYQLSESQFKRVRRLAEMTVGSPVTDRQGSATWQVTNEAALIEALKKFHFAGERPHQQTSEIVLPEIGWKKNAEEAAIEHASIEIVEDYYDPDLNPRLSGLDLAQVDRLIDAANEIVSHELVRMRRAEEMERIEARQLRLKLATLEAQKERLAKEQAVREIRDPSSETIELTKKIKELSNFFVDRANFIGSD